MSLPLIRLKINPDDETGVTAVALVDDPAIKINWQSFKDQKPYKFETLNAEKRIIAGPLMLADTPIYRRSEQRGEYNAIFFKEDIEAIVEKFHKNQFEQNVNPMHESMMKLPDIYLRSDFIIGEMGINTPLGFDQLAPGSWFGIFKVMNDEVWNSYIKTGVFKGFSVEGFFDEEPVQPLTDQDLQAITEVIS